METDFIEIYRVKNVAGFASWLALLLTKLLHVELPQHQAGRRSDHFSIAHNLHKEPAGPGVSGKIYDSKLEQFNF